MKNTFTIFTRVLFILMISVIATPIFSQTTLSREEVAINKAEQKLEVKRLRLVDYKIQIESADSLFVAGEKLQEDSKIMRAEAKDEVKAVEKQFKSDSKSFKKAAKNKDRKVAAQGRADLKALTTQYKIDLKAAQNKLKAAERNILNSNRMMDKADKKLDMLSKKLKVAEDAYKDAEKSLNEKKSGE